MTIDHANSALATWRTDALMSASLFVNFVCKTPAVPSQGILIRVTPIGFSHGDESPPLPVATGARGAASSCSPQQQREALPPEG
jgi:hypothetical protein